MTSIIAGAAGGRRLAVPPGTVHQADQRPDQGGPVRLGAAELGGLDGGGVLDSTRARARWASRRCRAARRDVLLVESDARAAAVIKANIEAVGLPGARWRRTGSSACYRARAADADRCDLVFADPPYAVADGER